MRFHHSHGKNISFDEQRLVATRINSFSHAMVFSERPLSPGEIFLVEIEETTDRWTGHMKIGFTSTPPDEVLERCTEEVVYNDILHLTVPSKPITQCTCGLYRSLFNINGTNDVIHTPFASLHRQSIVPARNANTDTGPTCAGSRIGVVYAWKQKSLQMHCVLNGFDYGPFAILKSEPSTAENDETYFPPAKRQRTLVKSTAPVHEDTKFWAFVDVYGGTKRVRIVQLYGPSTLRSLCRFTILSNLNCRERITTLPLHKQLKSYLKFQSA